MSQKTLPSATLFCNRHLAEINQLVTEATEPNRHRDLEGSPEDAADQVQPAAAFDIGGGHVQVLTCVLASATSHQIVTNVEHQIACLFISQDCCCVAFAPSHVLHC